MSTYTIGGVDEGKHGSRVSVHHKGLVELVRPLGRLSHGYGRVRPTEDRRGFQVAQVLPLVLLEEAGRGEVVAGWNGQGHDGAQHVCGEEVEEAHVEDGNCECRIGYSASKTDGVS